MPSDKSSTPTPEREDNPNQPPTRRGDSTHQSHGNTPQERAQYFSPFRPLPDSSIPQAGTSTSHDQSHEERWKEYQASIEATPDAQREKYTSQIRLRGAESIVDQNKGKSHEERWKEYQASIEAALDTYQGYYTIRIFRAESKSTADQNKGKPHEERSKAYQASIEAAPEAYQENYSKSIINEEIYVLYKNTENMPINERKKIQEDWLYWVPAKYKKGKEIREVINKQEHIIRTENVIKDKNLNMNVPDQNIEEWKLYSPILIDLFEDEKGSREHFHYLQDILEGGKKVQEVQDHEGEKIGGIWEERRKSTEYENCLVWVLKKWRDRNEEGFTQKIATSKAKEALEAFKYLETLNKRKISDKLKWQQYQKLIESAPNSKYKEKYIQEILEVEVDKMLDNTKEMSTDKQREELQNWLNLVIPDKHRPKCAEIIDKKTLETPSMI